MKNLLGLLEPIADSMQTQLHYSSRSGKVKGHRRFKVELFNGVCLPLNVEVESSFLYPAAEQSGLLFKFGGSLHVLMCYAGRNDTISAYILDARNFTGGQNRLRKIVGHARDLKDMVYHMTPGVVASYLKKPRRAWKAFDLNEVKV